MIKLTSQMTAVELARVVAENKGWKSAAGGYIKDGTGRTLAHGWAALADRLATTGLIRVGRGINWQRFHADRHSGFYVAQGAGCS